MRLQVRVLGQSEVIPSDLGPTTIMATKAIPLLLFWTPCRAVRLKPLAVYKLLLDVYRSYVGPLNGCG